ncbi:MAG: recombinase family protein [Armatimonadetes bacterium]|nr:recombinase family protein [Armatimonadota bacterium]
MRVFGYIRASKFTEGEGISPDIQRDEIERYCEQKGWTLAETFQDLDLSGRSWDRKKRKALDDLMARALAGECDAVVFYRIDRLSREEADFHPMLAALRRAGIHCDSPSNPNDGSAESDLIWSISAALAKYESVRLGARLKDAHRRLARTARWQGGPVPWGWKRVKDDAGVRLVADPELQTIRIWMHEKYQQGWALRRIARRLNEKGIPTRDGRTWSEPGVKVILTTPYQVGARVADGELVFGGNVEPLIPFELYRKTMIAMDSRKGAPQPGRPPRVPLTGRHVRCGTCGGPMYARYAHRVGDLYYQCYNRSHGLCERGVAVQAAWLIPEVERRLLERVKDARVRERTLRVVDPVEPLVQEVKRVEGALGQLTSLFVAGELLEGEYREARKLQMRRLMDAQKRLDGAVRRSETMVLADYVDETLRGLADIGPDGWAALSIRAKRDIMDVVIDRVIVYPKDQPRNRWAPPHRIKVVWR